MLTWSICVWWLAATCYHRLGTLKHTSQVGTLKRDLGANHVGISACDLVALSVKLKLVGYDRLGDETDESDLGHNPTRTCICTRIRVHLPLKRRDLERRLQDLGWRLQRHGGKHDVWTNAEGSVTEYVPRHAEINEILALASLRRAEERQ